MPRPAGPVHDQVGHIADQVSSQPQVEEHVEDVKEHLSGVDRMQISIADGGQRSNRPVHCCHVTTPQTLLLEVLDRGSDPRSAGIWVSRRYEIVEASGAVDREERHLKSSVSVDISPYDFQEKGSLRSLHRRALHI